MSAMGFTVAWASFSASSIKLGESFLPTRKASTSASRTGVGAMEPRAMAAAWIVPFSTRMREAAMTLLMA